MLGTFILVYCQVQLAEAIIWYGIDNNNLLINRIGTFLNKQAISLQLIGIWLIAG